ncbi:ADP-ribosyltransferase [Vibrio jasicida]|uniref:ADPrib_exo_Tox domain-containing protein n=1 Tax=Vibrio jasicida TaxID=766224 RepID=A0AAU9QFJ7_9VIBR|nr:ADP-ribosyltransferase [Vibrio jasicida]CAH1556128.1 ADPrib_exo_Tox domain-containing protein [Vibrio jasicida]CAH1566405.1 ADPrib_exo_Tox domain-containing protein [Vibrio jasicida]
MKKMILVFLLTFSIHHLVKAEDFVEFKGRDLSPVQQEQMADDLMDWSVENHAKAERKMIPEEYSAIKRYGRVDHDVVNEYMRAGEPKEFLMQGYGEALKSRVSHMRSVMNKLPNYKGTVYRGSSIKNSLLEKLNVGDILHEKAFLSTSTIPSVARNFSASGAYEGVSAAQFKIELKSSGRAINAYTFKPYEAEILAKPNTYFRVEAVERLSSRKNYIKIREIKNPAKYLKAEPDIHIYDSFSGEEVSLRSRSALYCL